MDDPSINPGYILLAFFVILIGLWISISIRNSGPLTFFFAKWIGWRFLPEIQREIKPHIVRNFPFYSRLDDRHRRLFEGRVQLFIEDKEFIPRGGIPEVTCEMKALIAGSAVQITFGYPNIRFGHFSKVLIYPNDYYSTITRKYHKGEVNLGGIIVLSYANLKESFRDHTDGIHLGFHEMAHALRLINLVDNDEYDFYDRELVNAFDRAALHEMDKIREGTAQSIFRDYAAVSIDEFFPVSVEVFFEQTDEFYQYSPTLYNLLSSILKLDPRKGKPIRVIGKGSFERYPGNGNLV